MYKRQEYRIAARLAPSCEPKNIEFLLDSDMYPVSYTHLVERIIKYFADNGFTLRKATANKLIARSAAVLENFYKAICQVVLQQDYVSADETYPVSYTHLGYL